MPNEYKLLQRKAEALNILMKQKLSDAFSEIEKYPIDRIDDIYLRFSSLSRSKHHELVDELKESGIHAKLARKQYKLTIRKKEITSINQISENLLREQCEQLNEKITQLNYDIDSQFTWLTFHPDDQNLSLIESAEKSCRELLKPIISQYNKLQRLESCIIHHNQASLEYIRAHLSPMTPLEKIHEKFDRPLARYIKNVVNNHLSARSNALAEKISAFNQKIKDEQSYLLAQDATIGSLLSAEKHFDKHAWKLKQEHDDLLAEIHAEKETMEKISSSIAGNIILFSLFLNCLCCSPFLFFRNFECIMGTVGSKSNRLFPRSGKNCFQGALIPRIRNQPDADRNSRASSRSDCSS